jgi:hypothetical protein
MAELFDRSRIYLQPLSERQHDLDLSCIKALQRVAVEQQALLETAKKIRVAKRQGAAVMLMMGAHVLRAGVQRYLIDLLERGELSCIAINGAGVIHDFEFALIGATTESVADYIRDGRFGMWQETGRINRIVKQAQVSAEGLGEAVGRVIEEEQFPHRDISLLAAGYRLGVPITVHVSIGQDIIHQHPDFDGGAFGATSDRDFLRFTKVLEAVENGVVMNFGSAVMAPEIYLKALSMVRNVARQEGRSVSQLTTLVCDLAKLPADFRNGPSRDDPAYYFRPWKTMLVRTVADGGESHYVCGRHQHTIPQLWSALRQLESEEQ